MSLVGFILIAFGAVLVIAAVFVPSFMLAENDHGWLALVYFGVTVAIAMGVLIWLIERDSGSDGVHDWRGGAGPATVCYYEERNEPLLVGKVTTYHDVTYTVCRDPQ